MFKKYIIWDREELGITNNTLDNSQIQYRCERLHNLCNSATKLYYPIDFKQIPENGIYIMFQENEQAHGDERIVRVGSHTGQNQLQSRIEGHYIKENKNRSILRKNIGRCFLKMRNDKYLAIWEQKGSSNKQINYEKELEKEISEYIRSNFHICIIKTDYKKETRMELESKIIATISLCNSCKPSERWLGLFSPIVKIKDSGLWQVQWLYKKNLILTDIDLEFIEQNLLFIKE